MSIAACQRSIFRTTNFKTFSTVRTFHKSCIVKMPEQLKSSEVNLKTDPSVAKQYDDKTPLDEQWRDLYAFIDGKGISMLSE